ncbi:sirohydrochlorin chelatase [Thermaerobacillus caldiproteolyticus]|uniref:Sirohydrochlorin ferrochelatase n=1 Tax=Thermaerobacillus caldiproteolyticus TaxID=247480 RepID=A0A7V9Z9C1_9BACL|nr:sirohydrochlorin chelatase [Anoxybacillus caldiproteolyticus]MBA2876462.1 sirohydrochlorin ferrochelatase [Anoxybacillus caldiproteolyticus]
MQAVLYVCHGSRIAKACEEAIAFVKRCQANIDISIQETCFIELTEPDIATGIDLCVHKGATRIAVIPVLLLAAGHAKHDIPEEIKKAQQRYPHLDIILGEPFGVHEKMIQIVTERIAEQSVSPDDDAMILLVGRGSSDPDTRRDIATIAQLLQEKTNVPRVDVCFLAAIRPSLQDGLREASRSSYKNIFVVPYLLFTGVLMKTIETKLRSLSSSNKQWILCNYLGYHPLLEEIVKEKVNRLLLVNKGV